MKDRLKEVKEKVIAPLRQATLVFLIKDKQILLAMKKRGFGTGKWNGVGGKNKDGENIEETARREANEEIGVSISSLNKVATLNFYFVSNPDWNQQVIVYLSDGWAGNPIESEEMNPEWFDLEKIPYDKMWSDDKFWLPEVLDGKIIEAEFLFDENQEMLDKKINEKNI
jgi:8-oxo-dGTP pyrophosphatase MutT (NUDIX family)